MPLALAVLIFTALLHCNSWYSHFYDGSFYLGSCLQSPMFGTFCRYYKPKGLVTSMRHLNTKKQMEVLGVQRWSIRRFLWSARTCVRWSPSLVMRRKLSWAVGNENSAEGVVTFVENFTCKRFELDLYHPVGQLAADASGLFLWSRRRDSQNHTVGDATMTLQDSHTHSLSLCMYLYDIIWFYLGFC